MSWLTVIASIPPSASLMVAWVHFFIWARAHREWLHLLFAVAALAAAGSGFVELALRHAASVEQYEQLIRWQHIPLYVMLVSIVWFVHLYFGTGRRWLAILISAMYGVALVINFASPHSLTFARITELRQGQLWGEPFTLAVGEPGPNRYIADLASILIAFFVADASVGLWRRGVRRRALIIGGSVVLFMVAAGIHTALVDLGWVKTPYLVSFCFLAIILAMSYELGTEVLQASERSRQVVADEKRWRSLLENVHLLALGLDVDGRITFVNPCFVATVGYPENEMLGRTLEFLVPDSERETVRGHFAGALEGLMPPSIEARFVTRAGEERLAVWSGVMLRDAENRLTGSLSIGVDVTEKRAAEEGLREARHEALQLHAELAHAGRLTTMGELAAALAHELNQPLTAIRSNAQAAQRFLRAEPPDLSEVTEILGDIVEDDRRAGEVIRRLRSFLRKGELQREPLDVNDIVREVANLLRSEAQMNNITIEMRMQDNLPAVMADRIQLQQVLVNLMRNAAEAMSATAADKRIVTVSTGRDGNGSIAVAAYDRGSGLDEHQLERLFEPFFTTKPQGLGLGLSLCRTIVKAHDGELSASNNPEGGATFRFTLPAV